MAETAKEDNGDDNEDVVDDREGDDGEDDDALEDEESDVQVGEILASAKENTLMTGNRKVCV